MTDEEILKQQKARADTKTYTVGPPTVTPLPADINEKLMGRECMDDVCLICGEHIQGGFVSVGNHRVHADCAEELNDEKDI